VLLLLLLLNPKRALSKGVFLSRAAIRRKSLQESRDTKLKYSSSLDERSLFFGQNFFSVNFLSLSLSFSLKVCFSLKKNISRLFSVRSVRSAPFRCFLVLPPFRVSIVVVIFTTTKERKHNLFTSV
tara:strand:- start:209 stop:586 length:378 start_codon:yes stop_codon:yes gene_type:complete